MLVSHAPGLPALKAIRFAVVFLYLFIRPTGDQLPIMYRTDLQAFRTGRNMGQRWSICPFFDRSMGNHLVTIFFRPTRRNCHTSFSFIALGIATQICELIAAMTAYIW